MDDRSEARVEAATGVDMVKRRGGDIINGL